MTNEITYLTVEEIFEGAFVVEAIVDGSWRQHPGPQDADFFTQEQAASVASDIQLKREFVTEAWAR